MIEKVADYVHMLDGFMIVVLIYVRDKRFLKVLVARVIVTGL